MRSMKPLNIIILALAIIGITACASTGSGTESIHQNPEKLKQLHINKSTKENVKQLLGEPQSMTTFSNESEQWDYQSTQKSMLLKKHLPLFPCPILVQWQGLQMSVQKR